MPTLEATDKQEIQRVVGKTATPLYSTIAKLYVCNENDVEWKDTERWGALTLIINRTPPISMHLKIFALQSFECLFTQEIDMTVANSYAAPSKQFHTFNAPHAILGLSFTDEAEAEEFYNKFISSKSLLKASTSTATTPTARPRKKSGFFSKMLGSIFTKEVPMEIGRPTSVVHKQHIGYDPDKGFETSDIPPEWASIFKNAGIRKKDLSNPAAARIIFDTLQSIDMNGAVPTTPNPLTNPAASDEIEGSNTPEAPALDIPSPPPPPSDDDAMPLPPLPPLPSDEVPAAPEGLPPPPPIPPKSNGGSSNLSVPPPPPPPGPPTSFAATQPLPPLSPASPKTPSKECGGNGRDDLLSAIQSGIALKKVTANSANNQKALPDASRFNSKQAESLADILKRRIRAVVAEDDDDDNDNDWA